MRKDRPEFRDEIERALKEIAQKHGVPFTNHIRLIVQENREKGRLDHFMNGNLPTTASDYVWLVVGRYLHWHEHVEQIQQEKSEDIWGALWGKLEHWAYHFLLRKGFHPGIETQELAQEYTSEAAMAVLQAPFPYDTELDAWLQQIVIYTCCNQIEAWRRQQALEKKVAQALEDEKPLKSIKAGIEHHVSSVEDKQVLYEAIQQLPNPKMRQVLWLRYYGEISSQEIAEVIGSSYRYVDKLHWQAKQKLGKILGS